MFPSQASYVFNLRLPFTPTVSIPLLSFDDLTLFPGAPILQKTAEFISASYYSSSNVFKFTASTTPLPHDPEGDFRSPYESLEDAVRRLIGDYRQLSTIIEDKQARYGDEQVRNLCFPQKVRTLAMINQFKSHILNLLYRLAVLTVEYPQECHLLRTAYRICAALTDSQAFRSSLQGHKSTTIYKLLNMISNVPLMIENSVFQDYSKDTYAKTTKTEDNEEEAARMLSLVCTAGQETSSSLIDMLMMKKSISCSDGDAEEESERHERSSTTSASSRTNHGEVDVPISYNVFGSSPESQKTASATKDVDVSELVNMHEIYDGCFFGDLTVTFDRSDKTLLEDDEIPVIESNGHHHTWRKNNHSYNNYNSYNNRNNMTNFPMPPMFNNANQNNNNNYPGFNQRFEEPNWKTNPMQTINPSLLKTPPTQDQKIIPLNLFTLPQGTFMPPANTFTPFNPANLIPQAPVQQQQQQQISTPPPYINRRVPANQEFKGIQQMKAMSEQKPRDVSRESQSSLLSDRQQHQQQQPQKMSNTNNKQSNSATAPKNLQIQADKNDKNVNAVKKGKSQNAKKKQDKGGIKLWDMISVQGKLKNF